MYFFHKHFYGIFETFFTVFFSECVFTFWVIGFPLLVKVLLVKSFCKASRGRIYAFAQNVISKKHFRDCLSNLFSNVFQIIVKMWYQRNISEIAFQIYFQNVISKKHLRGCLSYVFKMYFQNFSTPFFNISTTQIHLQMQLYSQRSRDLVHKMWHQRKILKIAFMFDCFCFLDEQFQYLI